MNFGKVENPEVIDYTLPYDHPGTKTILEKHTATKTPVVYVGCGKWNKQDLKNFFPPKTKDELEYYSTQFNSIELNATFYGNVKPELVSSWRDKTPEGFKFFPKIPQYISHIRRLDDVEKPAENFCESIRNFNHKLEMVFLQLHNNFSFKNFDRLIRFVENFPKDIPLAIEIRNDEWYTKDENARQLFELMEKNNITHIITDTAGRRDLLHMRLTTPIAFIRYVGANHPLDYARLDDWLIRLDIWVKLGLQKIYFFVHQNVESSSPHLSLYFIEKLNERLNLDLKAPQVLTMVK